MDANKRRFIDLLRDIRVGRVPPAAAGAASRHDAGRRRDCGDVARSRAARYARKRRIPKPLWPLIAALILIGMIFDRRAPMAAPRKAGRPTMVSATMAVSRVSRPDLDRLAASTDTGSAIDSTPSPQYRPSSNFLSGEVAQVIAFLIRNRGKLDTDAVRAKWDRLDRASLPLAFFLREVEAATAWDDLEKEIAAAAPGLPATLRINIPKSPRHRKLLRLMPEWSRRGEDLLTTLISDDMKAVPAPDGNSEVGPDQEPPTP